MALIPAFFLDCVVAIGFENSNKERHYAATGFLYGKLIKQEGESKQYRIFLVTNKHVFNDSKMAWLRFNPEGDESAKEFEALLVDKNDKQTWLVHPDPEVDLAILGINTGFLSKQGIRFSFFRSDQHIATREQATEAGISEGDGVFILGFPMGMIGEKRNFVIVKQGIIARIRDTLAGHSKEFLVDASIFPGNSGGPVVLRPEVVSITGTKANHNASLLGIVSSYVPYQDIAISAQTKRPRIIFEENSGLASIVPVDYIVEIIDATVKTKEETVRQEPPVEVSQSKPEEPAA
jgi:S1-C subfamily serine protease